MNVPHGSMNDNLMRITLSCKRNATRALTYSVCVANGICVRGASIGAGIEAKAPAPAGNQQGSASCLGDPCGSLTMYPLRGAEFELVSTMNGKKAVVLVLVLLVASAVTWQFIHWSIAKRQDPSATFIAPRLHLALITITDLSSETMDMDVRMLIDNPSPIGLAVDSFTYRFSIAGVEVARTNHGGAITLPAYDGASLTLPITVRQELLVNTLKELQARKIDSVDYAIDTWFYTRLPFLKETPIHLHMTRHLPLFIIPDVELAHTRIEKLGLKNTMLMLDLRVSNPNNIPFAFRNTTYEFRVGGDHVMRSSIDSVMEIPPRDTLMIAMPIQLDLGEAAGTLIKLLLKPGSTYAFTFDTHIVSDSRSINGSHMALRRNGTLRDLKQ
mgnify:CR=1 FL=1